MPKHVLEATGAQPKLWRSALTRGRTEQLATNGTAPAPAGHPTVGVSEGMTESPRALEGAPAASTLGRACAARAVLGRGADLERLERGA
eukprot:4750834-Alexandrium_andersonii.AAC.1